MSTKIHQKKDFSWTQVSTRCHHFCPQDLTYYVHEMSATLTECFGFFLFEKRRGQFILFSVTLDRKKQAFFEGKVNFWSSGQSCTLVWMWKLKFKPSMLSIYWRLPSRINSPFCYLTWVVLSSFLVAFQTRLVQR